MGCSVARRSRGSNRRLRPLGRRGCGVSGPVPADSVFHLARIGRYDAVLSLYHDQGHIAAKMMDFEKTVSVTLGVAGAADQRGSRHGVRYRRNREGERGQYDRGHPRGSGIRGARGEVGGCSGGGPGGGCEAVAAGGRRGRVRLLSGCSSMVERQLPKLHTRVRFPSPAPVISMTYCQWLEIGLLPGSSPAQTSDRVSVRSSPCFRAYETPPFHWFEGLDRGADQCPRASSVQAMTLRISVTPPSSRRQPAAGSAQSPRPGSLWPTSKKSWRRFPRHERTGR